MTKPVTTLKKATRARKRVVTTRRQIFLFRKGLGRGMSVDEAAAFASITGEQAIWLCRRDPLMQRLVDQEADLGQLQKQAAAVLNDATNPASSGGWARIQVLAAAKLVYDTCVKVNPDLLKREAEKPTTMKELQAIVAGEKLPAEKPAVKAPGTEEPQ